MADSLRVAVVGSGPAGFYAAAALLASDLEPDVDVLERLPTPWGLVRLGVAPDHPNIKAVSRAFERTASHSALALRTMETGMPSSVIERNGAAVASTVTESRCRMSWDRTASC